MMISAPRLFVHSIRSTHVILLKGVLLTRFRELMILMDLLRPSHQYFILLQAWNIEPIEEITCSKYCWSSSKSQSNLPLDQFKTLILRHRFLPESFRNWESMLNFILFIFKLPCILFQHLCSKILKGPPECPLQFV